MCGVAPEISHDVSFIEQKFATPKIVKNGRTGQVYSIGIGLPKKMFLEQISTFLPPHHPHFFQADRYRLIKDAESSTERNEVLLDRKKVNVLFMHGLCIDGQWRPVDTSLRDRGITIEDIVRDCEKEGKNVDVLFVCSNEDHTNVNILSFQDANQSPKVYMRNKPAQGNVLLDSKTGEVQVEMRIKSENDIEYKKWENWGRVKIVQE